MPAVSIFKFPVPLTNVMFKNITRSAFDDELITFNPYFAVEKNEALLSSLNKISTVKQLNFSNLNDDKQVLFFTHNMKKQLLHFDSLSKKGLLQNLG